MIQLHHSETGPLRAAKDSGFENMNISRRLCRYLNSVAAKALFRADHIDRAEKMAARFTKDSDQPNLLYEMQCMWYEIECGSAFLWRQSHGRVSFAP